MPSPNISGASRAQQRLRIAGVLVLVVGLMASVYLGISVSALQQNGTGFLQGYVSVNYLVHPVSLVNGQAATFNWLMFLLLFGPSLISSAVLFSGAEVCGAVARRTRSRTSSGSSADGTIALGD